MNAVAVVVGLLAGATVWSLQMAWATTSAARVRGRLLAPGSGRSANALPTAPRRLVVALQRAGVPWPADTVWAVWLGGSAAGTLGAAVIGGPALASVILVAATVGPVAGLRTAAGRGDRVLEAGVPAVLERVARALRAGATTTGALREAAADSRGELGDDLHRLLAEVRAGEPLVGALDGWAARRPLPSIRLAVAALALGAETGGAQAQALDGLAATLRDRVAVAAEVRALSSQARLSALVITVAPLGFALFAAATDPRSADFLLRTPAGIACLGVGLSLDGAAAWWMARLTRTPG